MRRDMTASVTTRPPGAVSRTMLVDHHLILQIRTPLPLALDGAAEAKHETICSRRCRRGVGVVQSVKAHFATSRCGHDRQLSKHNAAGRELRTAICPGLRFDVHVPGTAAGQVKCSLNLAFRSCERRGCD